LAIFGAAMSDPASYPMARMNFKNRPA